MAQFSDEIVLWKAPQKGRNPEQELDRGFDPAAYPGNGPYFALDRALAEEWQSIYENGLQEIRLSQAVFDELATKGIIRADGYYPERSVSGPCDGLAEFNAAIIQARGNMYHPQLFAEKP